MRGLFIIPQLPWPTIDGTCVTVHHLVQALQERGQQLHLLLLNRPSDEALAAWPLRDRVAWNCIDDIADDASITLKRPVGPLHERWLNYWDLDPSYPRRIAAVAASLQIDYVEAFGQSVLPLLGCIDQHVPLLWIAHDDRCLFHLSRLRTQRSWRGLTRTLRNAVTMASYERTYRHTVDMVSAVAPSDEKCLRRIGGFSNVQLIPLGVELPPLEQVTRNSAAPRRSIAFWGRLDYGPNIDAIGYFASQVWPKLYRRNPSAVWRVIGRNAGPDMLKAITGRAGIEMIGMVEDLTAAVCRSTVAIVPMCSGNGVKMKLLEAAAMARPIVTSPQGAAGAMADQVRPWLTANQDTDWISCIERLWNEPEAAAELGRAARLWVAQRHAWSTCADHHLRILGRLLERAGRLMPFQPSCGGIAA